MQYTNEQLIEFIRRYHDAYDTIPSSHSFHQFGYPSASTYKRRFGSWRGAVAQSGLTCQRLESETNYEMKCGQCQKELAVNAGNLRKSKSGMVFCSKSCSATYSNSRRKHSHSTIEKIAASLKDHFETTPRSGRSMEASYKTRKARTRTSTTTCPRCGTEFSHKPSVERKFCSKRCASLRSEDETVSLIADGRITSRTSLRKFLVSRDGYSCSCCELFEWLNKPIPLCVDHIDGDPSNDKASNLRLLCQNCHGQTSTFAGRNRGFGRKSRGIKRYDEFDKL